MNQNYHKFILELNNCCKLVKEKNKKIAPKNIFNNSLFQKKSKIFAFERKKIL